MWYIYTCIFYKVYIYKKQPAKVLEPITVISHPKITVSRSEIEDTQLCSHYFLNLKLHEWCYEDMLLKLIINTHNVTHIHIQLCLGRWKKNSNHYWVFMGHNVKHFDGRHGWNEPTARWSLVKSISVTKEKT